jgi:D-3-phosphoglycerate dehydrogenase
LLLNSGIHEEGIAMLRVEVEILGPLNNEQTVALEGESGIQAIISGSTLDLSAEIADLFPCRRVLSRPGIGVDNVDIRAATERGIWVVNTPDAPT